jgi:hypothetical protein
LRRQRPLFSMKSLRENPDHPTENSGGNKTFACPVNKC